MSDIAAFTGMGFTSQNSDSIIGCREHCSDAAVSKSPASAALAIAAVSSGYTLESTEMIPFPPREITGTVISSLPLHIDKENLNEESLLALEVMLSQSNDLAVAYHLKELFFEFMKSPDRTEAGRRLKFFILAAEASNLPEFNACLTMLRNWSKYILNAFDCPYTNGYTEGTNNAIKVIKRNAFGYRNFRNFRNRIFLALT